jgi:hypothetical protein
MPLPCAEPKGIGERPAWRKSKQLNDRVPGASRRLLILAMNCRRLLHPNWAVKAAPEDDD